MTINTRGCLLSLTVGLGPALAPFLSAQLIDLEPVPPGDDFGVLAEAFWHVHTDLFRDGPDDDYSFITFSWDGLDPTTATIVTTLGDTPPPLTDVRGFQFVARPVIPEEPALGPEFLMGASETIAYLGNESTGPQSFGFRAGPFGPVQADTELYAFSFPDALGGPQPLQFTGPGLTGFDALFYYENSSGLRLYHDTPTAFRYYYALASGPFDLDFINLLMVDDPADGIDFDDGIFLFTSGEIIGGIPEPHLIGLFSTLACLLAGVRRRR